MSLYLMLITGCSKQSTAILLVIVPIQSTDDQLEDRQGLCNDIKIGDLAGVKDMVEKVNLTTAITQADLVKSAPDLVCQASSKAGATAVC